MGRFGLDEHVPRVFLTTLRSRGHDATEARPVFGKATDDEELLRYCARNERILVTQDRKDFAGRLADTIDHAGIVLYTDSAPLRNDPETAVRTVERILSIYPSEELRNGIVWLDQWLE